jgi:hypothetical protein
VTSRLELSNEGADSEVRCSSIRRGRLRGPIERGGL